MTIPNWEGVYMIGNEFNKIGKIIPFWDGPFLVGDQRDRDRFNYWKGEKSLSFYSSRLKAYASRFTPHAAFAVRSGFFFITARL
jgi:hypothetical protein